MGRRVSKINKRVRESPISTIRRAKLLNIKSALVSAMQAPRVGSVSLSSYERKFVNSVFSCGVLELSGFYNPFYPSSAGFLKSAKCLAVGPHLFPSVDEQSRYDNNWARQQTGQYMLLWL